MSDIVEAVAKAIAERVEGEGVDYDMLHYTYRERKEGFDALARAAIEAYEKATAEQEMHDQRVIWEAVERMKITPADTPLMDAVKRGGYLDRVGKP